MSKYDDKYVYTYPQQSKLWKRFIDDIFLIWDNCLESFQEFITQSSMHSTITFTSEISSHQISFLGLMIYTKHDKLYTRLFTSAIDRQMYLNYNLKHPPSLKKSIPYSQFLRLKRLHSQQQYLLEAYIHLYFYFLFREYPHNEILQTL